MFFKKKKKKMMLEKEFKVKITRKERSKNKIFSKIIFILIIRTNLNKMEV